MKKKRGRPRKFTKRDKALKVIKSIIIVCVLILALEWLYIGGKKYFRNPNKNYFDGINDFIYKNDYYITVGSNNNNDRMIERAEVTKYDNNKEKIWEQIFNKGYNSSYLAVCSDNDNNTVAVGSYEKEKDGNKTAILVKYDSDGNVLFEKKLKKLDNTIFTSIISVNDGYIVTGTSIYNNETIGKEQGGALLLKYSKEGKLLWKHSYGDNKISTYNNLIIYDNYIYVVGKYKNNIGLISKYDINGNLITSKKINGIDDYGFTGIGINNGNLIISGGRVITSLDTDAVIIKLDLDLNYIREIVYKSSGKERFNEVIIDKENNIVTTGSSAIRNRSNQDNYDALIGKYSSELEKIDVIKYDDNKNDYFTQLRLIDNDYVVSGYSSYENEGYLSKFITYSDALKVLEVK